MTPRTGETVVDSPSWPGAPALAGPGRPLVSIVVSAYNYERYVEAMLASLEAQTYPAIEIVVVHDGGTDRTGELARRFVESTARPARLIDQPNAGMVKAIQRGFQDARGELVCFFDADDLMVPTKTELQVRQMRDHGADAVFGSFLWLTEDGALIPYPDAPEFVDAWDAERFIQTLVCSRGPMFTAGLFKRDLLASIGGPDQGLPMNDWPFMIRYARAARRVVVTRDVVFHYRKHATSHSMSRMRQLLGWKMRTVTALCPPETVRLARERAYRVIADEYLGLRRPLHAWWWFLRTRRVAPQPDEERFRRDVRWLLARAGPRGRLLRHLVRVPRKP